MEIYLFFIIGVLILIIFLLWDRIRRLSNKKEITVKEQTIKDFPQLSSSFNAILKSITDGLIIVEPKGYILLTNNSFKDILKISEPPEGKHFIEVIRNIDLLNLLRSAIAKKEKFVEEIIIKKAGKDIFLLAKAMPVLDSEGKISFLIVLLQDITRLKQLENMRRDFVANVSHELKTPITAIKGYAEALVEGAIDDKENSKKFIEIIKNQADRLTVLVEDLLTLSKIEFGDIKIEKEEIFVDDVVDSVFHILKDKAEKKGIFLEKEIHSQAKIFGDRQRFTQILINLVDNAVKFTEKGMVKVRVFKENNDMILSVEDTGVGIPKEHLPRIGERFYRVDRARSRQLGGTGLGLAIVKHLVLAHGWQLKIDSDIEEGTKVKIVISERVNKDIS